MKNVDVLIQKARQLLKKDDLDYRLRFVAVMQKDDLCTVTATLIGKESGKSVKTIPTLIKQKQLNSFIDLLRLCFPPKEKVNTMYLFDNGRDTYWNPEEALDFIELMDKINFVKGEK